ncbi:NAD-dependent epimerase/dehydratase family protein [Sphingomonas endolithica]|uniref:NAD-dependent epimerase/dehydratase family protein n=1 Tax=Sphingomonas endolithica TaxID=2972485 RepID=UPI0021AEB9CA|nr:NAD(P)-dependent oxidoreductase [Sphingomonas sp. ZFBP2030]
MTTIAITGGTGFVGKRLIDLALQQGYTVRALARRPQAPRDGVTWIIGALDTADALPRLLDGAHAAIHVAGIVNAPTRAAFAAGNVDGTRAMVAAALAGGPARFIHVSSLSAREPGLSNYGWSKRGGEDAVAASALDWTIVRPPAVYGPGDMEMRDVFRLARMGLALMPPPGRLSLIHVDDLARLLLTLVESDPGRVILEPDDGRSWTHEEFARAVGVAVGQRVLTLPLPKGLLSLAASADKAFRGDKAKLTQDRVNYLAHPDWAADPARRPAADLWQAAIATPAGLAATAAWYRANGLLR